MNTALHSGSSETAPRAAVATEASAAVSSRPAAVPPGRLVLPRSARVLAVILLLVAIAITWALPPDAVLGAPHTDVINQFAASRAFAADSIRGGDFPLWNPYTYAGQPFLGGFQSGLLYPPNAVFLFLPLSRAINFSLLLHLIVAGWGLAQWATQRHYHPIAAALAGLVLALGGVVLPHVYAGHLSNLCTLAWVPWMFAGLENWLRQQKRIGLFVASGAIALQILGGQMQYVFFGGVAAAIYALVSSLAERDRRGRALVLLAGCIAVGSLLAAAQLLPGLAAAEESVRSGRLDYDFAAVFAFPPENLLTAVAPGVLGGDPRDVAYWGRCYPWEMSAFVGIGALGFAALGLLNREPNARVRRDLVVAMLLVVLALGSNLPLYRLLYDYVPGFDRFRGMSKFMFPAALFVLLLSARGIDACVRGYGRGRPVGVAMLALGSMLGVLALYVRSVPAGFVRVFEALRAQPENDFPHAWFAAPDFLARAADHATGSLFAAAALALVFGVALWLSSRMRAARWVALLVVPFEIAMFAASQATTTPLGVAVPAEVKKIVANIPGDARVLNVLRPNNGYLLGAGDLWGNDPLVLKRFAEFMTFTQGGNPDLASQNLEFKNLPPLYAMLRCRFAFSGAEGLNRAEFSSVLPRALLVSDYVVRPERDAVLAELARAEFDPRRTVVLETEPKPAPSRGGGPGSVRVRNATSDTLELDVENTAASVLLITDLYSRGWRVRSLGASGQQDYEIMPANHVLRAVPLAAGRHRLRMEYWPPGLTLGIVLSALASLAWIVALVRLNQAKVQV